MLQTEPSNISLYSINNNVVQSGKEGINGGFFWENQLLSIGVMDGISVNGSPKEYGSGWFNVKYVRGTIVYDGITGMVDVQRASSVDDLHVTDRTVLQMIVVNGDYEPNPAKQIKEGVSQ